MTVGLLFHNNDDSTSRFFIDYTYWDDFLSIWGFDILIMITENDKYTGREHTYNTLDEAMQKYPNHIFIALDPAGETKLQDFIHPIDNVIYIIGSDNWIISQMPTNILHIRIDTPVDSNIRPMRNIAAANILVFHRDKQVR
jgi:hypothetical protein